MRVTHVIFNFCTGGTENMLIDIMRSQLSLGASVSLVIINDNNEQALVDAIPQGVKLVMIGRPQGSKNPWYIIKYNMALRRLRPDVIHIHTVKAAGMIVGTPAPMGLTVHCCGAQLSYLNRYSRLWAISQAVSDDVRQRYGCESTIVYNGIDTSALTVATDHDDAPHPLRIVQIGRLEPHIKGQDLVLKAVALLDKKPDGPGVEVTFIGAGGGMQELRDMAASLGVADRVKFAGNEPRSRFYPELCLYDLLIQPSRSEGFGLTVAEGMAAGIPVACSDNPGIMEVVDGGKYATVFKAGSAEAIAEAITDIATHYPQRLRVAREEARRWVNERYSVDATASSYLEQYRQLRR